MGTEVKPRMNGRERLTLDLPSEVASWLRGLAIDEYRARGGHLNISLVATRELEARMHATEQED